MSFLRAALGNGRQNDIVDQGKVNRNFALDVKLIHEKKNNLRRKDATDFPGTFSNEAFSIYKGELMFTRRTLRPGNYLRNNPTVFSNWLGHEKIITDTNIDTNEEYFHSYEDEVEFVGIAQGGGSVFDDKTKHQALELAGTSGGTQTIVNNGSERLKNGDRIMWKRPTRTENNKEYKGSERWLAEIEVYKPEKHRLTVKTFVEFLKNSDLFDNDSSSLLIAFKNECQALQTIINKISVDATFLQSAQNPKLAQRKHLENLFVIVDRFNWRVKRRIFATVLSPAEPGEKVDILLTNSLEVF